MYCDEITAVLNDRKADSLSPAQRASVDAHLAACRACAGAWLVAEAIGRERWPDPPGGLLASIVAGLDERSRFDGQGRAGERLDDVDGRGRLGKSRAAARPAARGRARRWLAPAGALAASVAVAVALAVWPDGETPAPSAGRSNASLASEERVAAADLAGRRSAAVDTAAAAQLERSEAMSAFELGRHYRLVPNAEIPPAQAGSIGSAVDGALAGASPSRVEVALFFMYRCFPCFAFEPQVEGWESKADYVDLVRVPVVFNPEAELHARAYYAAEALGKLDEMHDAFFAEIHERGNPLESEAAIAELFARFGVDDETFRETFRSPAVDERVAYAVDLARALGIDAVPSLVVAGRYVTSPSMTGSYEDTFAVVEGLAQSVYAVREAMSCAPAVPRLRRSTAEVPANDASSSGSRATPRQQDSSAEDRAAHAEPIDPLLERSESDCPF